MTENMGTIGEYWVIAADRVGIWHVLGDRPGYTAPVPADSEPHFEIELELLRLGLRDRVTLMHSTSWRVDYKLGGLVVTYMVVMAADDLVRGIWPDARPVTALLADTVGRPPTHAADEAPAPRHIDVLLHGLRHLRFLLEHDATNAAAMGDLLRCHLEPLVPAQARMYDQQHEAA
jgi:hypothetical protein